MAKRTKGIVLILIATLAVTLLTACGGGAKTEEPTTSDQNVLEVTDPNAQGEYYIDDIAEFGLQVGVLAKSADEQELSYAYGFSGIIDRIVPNSAQAYKDRLTMMYVSKEITQEINEMQNPDEVQVAQIEEKLVEQSRGLFVVSLHDEREYDGLAASGKTLDEITGNKNSSEIGRQEGIVYLFSEPVINEAGLSEASAKRLKELQAKVPEMRQKIKLIPIKKSDNEGEFGTIPVFSAKDLSGNSVDNSIFTGKKLTMINFWGTFCGPCIDEMPDLGKLGKALPEGAALIGVVIDADSEENIQLAKEILSTASADFINIVPDDAINLYASAIQGVPTTIFVDQKGNQVGSALVGSRDQQAYLDELNARLKLVN